MNKTAIKNFAIWARNKLIADISYRAGLMGITADGIHPELPQSTGQTKFYDIGTPEPYAISGEAIHQREHLADLIRRKAKDSNYQTAYKYIIEEVAYTWFNRLIAVRFMEVNDYLPSHIRVLSSDQGKIEPDLVTTPFDADLDFTRDEQQAIIDLKNDNKLDELFRLLFIKQCNALNEILPDLFEKTNDYTELLLNLSVIDQDGVVYHLVHDIPEKDFDVKQDGQVEIIGSFYQYYISERHDEVVDPLHGDNIKKDDIPAATQIFTTDWVVRFLVDNSLGKYWIDHRRDSSLKRDLLFLVSSDNYKTKDDLDPKSIRVIDPCMGSGHFLVYAFDVLIKIYEECGFSNRDAAELILENNIYGLDIDKRAFQIGYFALLMKARQYNRRVLEKKIRPDVYEIVETDNFNTNHLKYFGKSMNQEARVRALDMARALVRLFINAKEFGSLLEMPSFDWKLLREFVDSLEVEEQISFQTVGLDDTKEELCKLISIGKVMSKKYQVVVTNPPYMNKYDDTLRAFINENYKKYSADLFSTFVYKCLAYCEHEGYSGLMTPNVWMFIPSYEKLRKYVIDFKSISTLIQMAKGAFFKEATVDICAFVIENSNNVDNGIYFRLEDFRGGMELQREKVEEALSDLENCSYVYKTCAKDFKKISGAPFAYWLTPKVFNAFSNKTLGQVTQPKVGLQTGDNNSFLRLWNEVDFNRIALNMESNEQAKITNHKWFPYNKGGAYRKWYGNIDYIVNWEHDGFEIRNCKNAKGKISSRPQNTDFYFKPEVTWSDITSGDISFRYFEKGFIFDASSNAAFVPYNQGMYLLGYLNTPMVNEWTKILNPTIHFKSGDFQKLPFVEAEEKKVINCAKECISISKEDWDSFEFSWSFKTHPLVKLSQEKKKQAILLKDIYPTWEEITKRRFYRIKELEEYINSVFINAFDLMDEMQITIPNNRITIRLADRKRDIKSLLSYAVGCMFGRFSLDAEGLVCTNHNINFKQYTSFMPDEDNVIPITDEEYLEDDIVNRLCAWLKTVFGKDTLEQNLDYIALSLDNKGETSKDIIRNYFLSDFFKDHCNIFAVTGSGRRPMYWLFDSGKQNGFKALIYLHRYNADTIGNLRIDYLHRMQRIYESEIGRMQDMIDHSTNAREAGQATKRKDKLTKQLKECREYDEKLAHLALSRIELDLDDGVKVNYRKMQTANDGKFYEVLADSKNIMAKK